MRRPGDVGHYSAVAGDVRNSGHEQDYRHRPGHDQLRGGGDGRRRTGRHHQPGRQPDHAVSGGVHQVRRAAGRPGRQASGRHEPGEHRLLDQAVHGPQVRRSQRRDEDGAVLRSARASNGDVRVKAGGKELLAARNLRDDPAEAEAGGGGVSRPAGHARRSSRSRRTSTTRSARRRRTPARSPASK